MFASPPYTSCPAGVWTTIFRGPVIPFGIINIGEASHGGSCPRFEYQVISANVPYFYSGSMSPNAGLPTGPTVWAECKVKPSKQAYLLATGW